MEYVFRGQPQYLDQSPLGQDIALAYLHSLGAKRAGSVGAVVAAGETVVATVADRHCHLVASVGGVNAAVAFGKAVPEFAVPTVPPVYGTNTNEPLPAR
jgi:hypothetical protein